MVIYAEYLFLENFITGILILTLTGKICGFGQIGSAYSTQSCGGNRHSAKNARIWHTVRLIFSGALCGLFAFMIFVSMGFLEALALKILFSALVVTCCYPQCIPALSVKSADCCSTAERSRIPGFAMLARAVVVFYAVSFIMGGVTIAVINSVGVKGISANGYVYTGVPTYSKVAAGVLLTYWLVSTLVRYAREKINSERLLREVDVLLGDNRFSLVAYTDTGNHLRDPMSNSPVSVISRSAAEAIGICMPDGEIERRFCVIPFRSAGAQNGIMNGFRADELRIYGRCGAMTFRPAVFAIYEGDFKERSGLSDFDVLLNREIIEGGVI